MKRETRNPERLSALRRALYDAIKEKGVSEAHLSRLARNNSYFINKYLWRGNPQELPLEEGIKIAKELDIDPAAILGDRYTVLTEVAGNPVIKEQQGVGNETRAEKKKMSDIYDIAVVVLSKLSANDRMRAALDANNLAEQKDNHENPRSREITS